MACGAAGAQGELLLPAQPVSPDGFAVSVPGGAPLTAEGAAVQALRAGEYLVTPRGPGGTVTLRAGGLSQSVRVGPPSTSVAITLAPASPVKGRDRDAQLDVVVRGADGRPDAESAPPVLRANVGLLEGLAPVGPGHYRAKYLLPTTRYPEVAIIVAFTAWPHPQSIHGSMGVLRVPLATAVEVPGRTEAGAEMRLTIAGQSFGPVTAGPDGAFRLPVVVPPGYGKATGTAVDRIGNKRTVPIDLMLPPTDQLACVVTPSKLPADGASKARVLCATSDKYGAVAKGAKVKLAAKRGAVGEGRDLGDGVSEFTWTAPRERGDGAEGITAVWKQGGNEGHEDLRLDLVQGPVAKAELVGAREPIVHLGSTWRFALRAVDSLGRPVPGVELEASAPQGQVESSPSDEKGGLQAKWVMGAQGALGAATLTLRVWGPKGTEPARLSVWREAGQAWASVTDLAGLPIPGQRLHLGERGLVTGADGTVSLGTLADGAVELKHDQWPGLRVRLHVRGGALFPAAAPPGRVLLELPVTVAPPVPVNVRIEREGAGLAWWLEAPSGEVVDDREVELTVNGQPSRARSKGHSTVPLEKGAATISVVDLQTHVGAAAEVHP